MTNEEALAAFSKVGGPAFPTDFWQLPDGGKMTCPGMMLRDYFAGQALAGILAMAGGVGIAQAHDAALSQQAYELADAMLAAREAQP